MGDIQNNINHEELLELFNSKLSDLKTLKAAPYDKIAVGDFLDVRDSVGEWRVGRVYHVSDNMVFMRLDGWKSLWDEKVGLNSNKLIQFRMNTVPYTGPPNQSIREIAISELFA